MKRDDIVTLFDNIRDKNIDIRDYMITHIRTHEFDVQTGICLRHYVYRDMLSIIVTVTIQGRTVVCDGCEEEDPKGWYVTVEDNITVTTLQGTVINLIIRCKE